MYYILLIYYIYALYFMWNWHVIYPTSHEKYYPTSFAFQLLILKVFVTLLTAIDKFLQ